MQTDDDQSSSTDSITPSKEPVIEDEKTFDVANVLEDESIYLFPFALSTLVWVIVSFILTRVVVKREKRIAYFLPMAIPGIVLISILMAIYDSAWLYPEKGVTGHA